jgi:hypothetical protein
MDNILKEIANLKKQNEGLESSFNTKNIKFTKLTIENVDPETEQMLLKEYNEYLKNISKQNRPPPQPKQEKPKEQPKPKEPKENEDVDDDDTPKESKPVYSTITNMEDIKRAFFNREYETFTTLVKQQPFKFYKVNYKYSSDNTGRPSYVAKNLLRGFVQGLDDYRKYFMICFRCILINKETNEYRYPSYWIVNTNDDLKTVLGSAYDDYNFVKIEDEDHISIMLKKMERNEDAKPGEPMDNDEALIGEVYLH